MDIRLDFDAIHTEKDTRLINIVMNKFHEQLYQDGKAQSAEMLKKPKVPYTLDLPGGVTVKNVVHISGVTQEGVYRTGMCHKITLHLHTEDEKD